MVRRLPLALLLLLAGCASQQRLPPDEELEWSDGALREPSHSGGLSAAPENEADLAAAFDGSKEAPEALSAPAKPAQPLPVVDPRAETRAAFRDRLGAARQGLAAGRLEETAKVLGELEATLAQAPPEDQQDYYRLAFHVAEGRKETPSAREAAESWLRSCGPQKPDNCRALALAALERSSALAPKSPATRERVLRLRKADGCVRKTEASLRSRAPPAPCLDEALGTYRRITDEFMVARAHLAKGLALATDEKKIAQAITQLDRSHRACTTSRCKVLRHKALKNLVRLHLAGENLEQAARAALMDSRLGTEELPPAERLYSWSEEAERACARYDSSAGAGACRKLEKTLFGDHAFRDFSKQQSSGEGLAAQTVKAVNEHYGVLLQECLGLEADRLVPPASMTYAIRWMVSREGRVEQLIVGRRGQPEGPLAICLKRQFALWRYPRYEGEAQHIEQSFTVSARERRTLGNSP